MLESSVWCLWPQTADTCFQGALALYRFLLLARSGPCILNLGEGLEGLHLIGKHSGEAGDLVPVQAARWSLRGHWLLRDSLVERREPGAPLLNSGRHAA